MAIPGSGPAANCPQFPYAPTARDEPHRGQVHSARPAVG
ncbi:hypothetical protein EDD30_0102 [Couchioplanes caeruleus]|uniref:Uncharacterized protein n=1 Tax=Couchioplanes caeruleus TaxID=56438 RepID=A0A3N1GB32_9ACTN|nr:hypothetical protein EDD30_0102 [Couchioplanes caeruleus]